MASDYRKIHTLGCFIVRIKLLEQAHSIVNHVRLLREFILGRLHLLGGEKFALGKVGKEGEDQMSVTVRDNRFCEVVLGHCGQLGRSRSKKEESSSCRTVCSRLLPTGQKMAYHIGKGARGQARVDARDTSSAASPPRLFYACSTFSVSALSR